MIASAAGALSGGIWSIRHHSHGTQTLFWSRRPRTSVGATTLRVRRVWLRRARRRGGGASPGGLLAPCGSNSSWHAPSRKRKRDQLKTITGANAPWGH
eukprot:scaffold10581_cov117-Isochrysis_galbana.AAC.12